MNPVLWLKNDENFGDSFVPKEGDIHVLVVVPEGAAGSAGGTSEMMPVAKRQRLEVSISLAEIWKRSELRLEALPDAYQLAALLEQPLPFRVTLDDSAVSENVFDPTGPLVSCPKLEASMNYFLLKCDLHPDPTASENTWQEYYDILLSISTTLCHGNGFTVLKRRNRADPTGATQPRKRPDCILQYDGVVLMRGEEKSSLILVAVSVRELTSKMCRWSVLLYGDLPYILGYATSGSRLQMVAIERSDGPCRPTPILTCHILTEKARALKVFYNLAFLLAQMSSLVKRSSWCNLLPFVPDVNEKRELVLLDDVVERTIRRTQCTSAEDIERLVDVYKTLANLSDGCSRVMHLQTVVDLRKNDDCLVVTLSPIGSRRVPESDG
ncbi:hypothetical protein BBJ28_00023744, partial [Nothophytophthora sp. Chile5]